jgi:hypothetical protein
MLNVILSENLRKCAGIMRIRCRDVAVEQRRIRGRGIRGARFGGERGPRRFYQRNCVDGGKHEAPAGHVYVSAIGQDRAQARELASHLGAVARLRAPAG